MKKGFLALAILSGATALVLSACADDVIDVTNQEKYAIVDELDSNSCTEEMEGAMQLVKSEGLLYACSDGKWFVVNPEEAVDFRCKSEPLKDSSGYKILCDGEEIGIVKSGKDGKDADPKAGESGVNGKSAYELAKENGYKGTEEEWLESLAGADGEAAYELAKKNGYKGTKEEFLESLNGADGKTLYELETENGYKGSEKGLRDSLDGKDADPVNGDSLASALETELAKALADSLKCKIDSSWVDAEKSEVNVKVSCGNGTKVITLPTLIPNKNLTTHYKKHVVVRFAVQAELLKDDVPCRGNCDPNPDEMLSAELWSRVTTGKFADLTVREVDEKFDQTGKKFIADLVASDAKAFVTVEETNATTRNFRVVRLEGDIDVTNLMNSYAQLRVNLDLSYTPQNSWFGNTSTMTFNAFVNLDDADTVVIDFLTDYKAARVKELLASKDFAAASAQANKELVTALHISDNAESFPALEHYLPSETGLNEYFASTVWPVLLATQTSSQNFNTVYGDYRTAFAKNGNLKAALKEVYKGKEYSMFFVDYLALLVDAVLWDGYEEDYEPMHYETSDFKIVQASFKEAYNLPEADKDTAVQVEGDGYFEYFAYLAKYKIWYPVVRGSLLNEYEGWLTNPFVTSLTGTACNEENLGHVASVAFRDGNLTVLCDKHYGVIVWKTPSVGDKAICAQKENGEYVKQEREYSNGTTYYNYYRCFKGTTPNNEEYLSIVPVDATDYYAGTPCTLETEDGLFTMPASSSSSYFYHCQKSSKIEYTQSSTSSYVVDKSYFDDLDPTDTYDFAIIAKLQEGECTSANAGIKTIFGRPGYEMIAECDSNLATEHFEWHLSNTFNLGATETIGVCDVAEMDKQKVYSAATYEWAQATYTGNKFIKCDCEYNDSYIRFCNWMAADALDVKLDKACVYSADDDTACDDDGNCYYCERSWDCSSSTAAWEEASLSTYCSRAKKEVKPLNASSPTTNQNKLFECKYKGKTYVAQGDGPWQDENAYCTSQGADCGPNMTSSGQHVCMFRKGFEGETPYKCNVESYTWEEFDDVTGYCNGINPWALNGCSSSLKDEVCDYTNGTTYACCITAEATETDPAEYGWVEGSKCPATETPVDDTDNNG
jgi:hypothetical protein